MVREQAIQAMRQVFAEAPYGAEHTLRVLRNTELIRDTSDLTPEQQEALELAAILHDIGALEALHKYGSMEGAYQEQEGEILAGQILEQIGADAGLSARVCFLVGHHHTPQAIDGLDFQILWEADQLDNLEYGEVDRDRGALEALIEERFRTPAGRALARRRLLKPD